jgi:hypothetical protein
MPSMQTFLFSALALLVVAFVLWQVWLDRQDRLERPCLDAWNQGLDHVRDLQDRGLHREARLALLELHQNVSMKPLRAPGLRRVLKRLSGLLLRDPVYRQVIKRVRARGTQGLSEMALCLSLGDCLVEDVRQSLRLASLVGQVQLSTQGDDTLILLDPGLIGAGT